ncbi:hypothetical protein FXO37_07967 [Capsicum annuum]|nr:hypothetical protein FXO37_07967 [Capsicum annuum]
MCQYVVELVVRKNDAQSILISGVYFSYSDTYSCFMFQLMIIVRVHAYDKESCTLLLPSMMSSQFVQQSESFSLKVIAGVAIRIMQEMRNCEMQEHEISYIICMFGYSELSFNERIMHDTLWLRNRTCSLGVMTPTQIMPWDCGVFVARCAEYLWEGMTVPSVGFEEEYHRMNAYCALHVRIVRKDEMIKKT